MDISTDVKMGIRFSPPKDGVDGIIKFYSLIRDLMTRDREAIEKGVVIEKSNGMTVARTPSVEGIWDVPHEFKDVIDWSTEAPEYGAWVEVDLSHMNSPKLIFTASKPKSFYRARNLLRLPISGWGTALTFENRDGAVFYSEAGTVISDCNFTDLIDVANDSEWLHDHRVTCVTWIENGRTILQFRKF